MLVTDSPILNSAVKICKYLDSRGIASPMIAGGALRDLVTGAKPVKDIDILLRAETGTEAKIIATLANLLVAGKLVDKTETSYYGMRESSEANGQIVCVFEIQIEGEPTIDLIFLNTNPINRIALFPCNASRIYLRPSMFSFSCYELKKDSSFNQFLIHNQLSFLPSCPREYYERMVSYYPKCKITAYPDCVPMSERGLSCK
ncbi:MAG: hypothetical protein ACRCUS_00920 [Anaerovoracaceae bacterium]